MKYTIIKHENGMTQTKKETHSAAICTMTVACSLSVEKRGETSLEFRREF